MDIKKLEMLNEISAEVQRFQKKLKAAIDDENQRIKEDYQWSSSSKFSACKRSALDLKVELSKLTLFKR